HAGRDKTRVRHGYISQRIVVSSEELSTISPIVSEAPGYYLEIGKQFMNSSMGFNEKSFELFTRVIIFQIGPITKYQGWQWIYSIEKITNGTNGVNGVSGANDTNGEPNGASGEPSRDNGSNRNI
ncbi:2868_t:CDS:2, partial [Dentiscutata heterogama]